MGKGCFGLSISCLVSSSVVHVRHEVIRVATLRAGRRKLENARVGAGIET